MVNKQQTARLVELAQGNYIHWRAEKPDEDLGKRPTLFRTACGLNVPREQVMMMTSARVNCPGCMPALKRRTVLRQAPR